MNHNSSTASPYESILVAVDNSKYSNAAVRSAVALARSMGSRVVGMHVYAAQLHERRFLSMEPGLPGDYSDTELQRQRSVHESLIAKGLRLISESYLGRARAVCEHEDVPFEGRLAEGRNFEEIVREARKGEHDLVVLGALGLGARRRSLIGSVCERVLRAVPGDVMVARDPGKSKGIMVAIDGSPNSYHALGKALTIGAAVEQPVEAVTAYDPQFHIVAFKRLEKVLSEEAATLFRFKEQEKLHSEIIDKGLERLYRSYLDKAEQVALAHGGNISTTLLTGKPFQRILDYVDQRGPWLLVAGRFGQHGSELADIGSTTENLVRLAPCSVMVVSGSAEAPPGTRAALEEKSSMFWTEEAEARLQPVSDFAQPIVRLAVETYAQRHGYKEVTPEVVARAREEMGW